MLVGHTNRPLRRMIGGIYVIICIYYIYLYIYIYNLDKYVYNIYHGLLCILCPREFDEFQNDIPKRELYVIQRPAMELHHYRDQKFTYRVM